MIDSITNDSVTSGRHVETTEAIRNLLTAIVTDLVTRPSLSYIQTWFKWSGACESKLVDDAKR